MTPLVSIIIPFYNSQDYLSQTIDSVLASLYPNVEIILIDDGSTDRSIEIAEKYVIQYPNISLYKQKNQGVSVARNLGISNAKGTYIIPVDSDDMIYEKYIEEAVKTLETNPNVKVVTAEGCFFGNKTGKRTLPNFDINLLARKNTLHVSSVYRKSDWIRIGGYCPKMLGREDWDFWISMLKDGGDVVKLPIIGYKYRIRDNSKRIRTRNLKAEINDILNSRHKEFYKKTLWGPLRYQRTWSKPYNKLLSFLGLLKD
jgi:glycosyltransferase involved in cell wall biosynthesis